MRSRIASGALAILLILTLLPASAALASPVIGTQPAGGTVTAASTQNQIEEVFAYKATATKSADVWVITLTGDVEQASQLRFEEGSFVLDLCGHSISGMPTKQQGVASVAMVVKNNAYLTIRDTGTNGQFTNANGATISLAGNNANLTVEGGYFRGGAAKTSASATGPTSLAAVQVLGNSHLTVKGGTFIGGSDGSYGPRYPRAYAIQCANSGGLYGRFTLAVEKVTNIFGVANSGGSAANITIGAGQLWKYGGNQNNWRTLYTDLSIQREPFKTGNTNYTTNGMFNTNLYFRPGVIGFTLGMCRIVGIPEGYVLPVNAAEGVSFVAIGANMEQYTEGTQPRFGDVRARPESYTLNGSKPILFPGNGPYEDYLALDDMVVGQNELVVSFVKEVFVSRSRAGDDGVWVAANPAETMVRRVRFVYGSLPPVPAPATGDTAAPWLWAGLLALGLLGALTLALHRRSRRAKARE